jgi:hypothetical protein
VPRQIKDVLLFLVYSSCFLLWADLTYNEDVCRVLDKWPRSLCHIQPHHVGFVMCNRLCHVVQTETLSTLSGLSQAQGKPDTSGSNSHFNVDPGRVTLLWTASELPSPSATATSRSSTQACRPVHDRLRPHADTHSGCHRQRRRDQTRLIHELRLRLETRGGPRSTLRNQVEMYLGLYMMSD